MRRPTLLLLLGACQGDPLVPEPPVGEPPPSVGWGAMGDAVDVVAPRDGAVFPEGAVVRLAAGAAHADAIRWTSDLAGPLGEVPLDGAGLAVLDVVLPPGPHRIGVEAVGADEPAHAVVRVRVDAAPSAPQVTLPDAPDVRADLVARVVLEAVDPEGAPVELTWSWTVDGVDAGVDGPEVPNELLRRGQVWKVVASPSDGLQAGPDATATTTIVDAPPVLVGEELVPAVPRAGDVVGCFGTWIDPDGDPVTDLGFHWLVDGFDVGDGPVLPAGLLLAGRTVRCVASAQAGDVVVRRVAGDARVLDALPEITAVSVVPSTPEPGGRATCRVVGAFDPEDDLYGLDVRWELDGAPLGVGPAVTVPAAPGARLGCTATPVGSGGAGRPASASVRIGGSRPPGSVLLVVLDDVGVDGVGAYAVGTPPPPTPNLDGLAAEGVRFDRAWSHPTCSPTRAALLTGRYGVRTGFGRPSDRAEAWGLPDDAITVPEALARYAAVPYASAAIGKWHVGTIAEGLGHQPLEQGFDVYRGVPGNLRPTHALDGGASSFTDYEYVDGDLVERRTAYLTVSEADDAIEVVTTLPEPWFVQVAFHAAHAPWKLPPAEVWSGAPTPGVDDRQAAADAMIEAMDRQIGRLLAALPAGVTVVVVGDNGTPDQVSRGPYAGAPGKSSVFEGGVRVPLIVAGPHVGVPGAASDALVSVTDVFATALELGGADLAELPWGVGDDSVSLLPYLMDPTRPSDRVVGYTEMFAPNGPGPWTTNERAVRDDTWKLVRLTDDSEALHRLDGAWIEGADLLAPAPDREAILARNRLAAWLDGNVFR